MFVRSWDGGIVNLANAMEVFIDENADGTAKVEAIFPVENSEWYYRFVTLAEFASASEAQSYIDDLANQIGAVTPRANSELATTEAKQ